MYKNDRFKFSGAQCFKQMRHTNLCVEREHFSHSINANPRVMRRSFNDVLSGVPTLETNKSRNEIFHGISINM